MEKLSIIFISCLILFIKCHGPSDSCTTMVYCNIVNLSDSSVVLNYSFHSSNMPNNFIGIEKKRKILLPKDSILTHPSPTRYEMKDIYKVKIENIFDDTIFINYKGSTIKKNIYNKSNWEYFPKKSSKDYNECIMRFVINNKDL